MADQDSNYSAKRQKSRTPILEWIIAAIGVLLVAGTIAFLIYEALTSDNTPPEFASKVERIDAVNSGYLVLITLTNTGDQTASGVNVEGELKDGGESVETSDVTFDYAPSNSEIKGGLFFKTIHDNSKWKFVPKVIQNRKK